MLDAYCTRIYGHSRATLMDPLLLSLLLQLHGSNMKLNMTLSLTWCRRNADGPKVVRSFNERSERRGGDEEKILVCFVVFFPIFFCMFYSSFSPSSPTNTRRALAKSGSNETAPSPWLPALQGTPKDVREDDPFLISSAFNGCCCSSSGRLLTTEKGAS